MSARGSARTRSTKNSQRIQNLEQQDKLYKEFLSKSLADSMASGSETPATEKSADKHLNSGDNTPSGSEPANSAGDSQTRVEGTTSPNKHQKRDHVMSDSGDDQQESSPTKRTKVDTSDRVVLKPKKSSSGHKSKQKSSTSQGTVPTAQNSSTGQSQFGFPGMFNYQHQFPMFGNMNQSYQDSMNNWFWQNQQMPYMPMQGPPESDGSEEESDDQDIQVISSVKKPEKNLNPDAKKSDSQSEDQEAKAGRLGEACAQEASVKTKESEKDLGPPAPENLVAMLKNFLERSRKQANVDELLNEFPRPENMPFLKSPKIEEDLYPKIAQHIQKFDKGCRWLQKYVSGAISAMVRAMSILIEKEKIKPDNELYQAGVQIQSALKLLAFTHTELNHRRKDALRNTVNADCQHLLKHNRPSSDDWLLGQNLSDSLKEMEDSKKLSDRILKQPKQSFTPQQSGSKQANAKGKRFRYKKGQNRGGSQPQVFRMPNPNQGFMQAQPLPFPGMAAPVQFQAPRFQSQGYQTVPFQPQNTGYSGWRQTGPNTSYNQHKKKH